MSDPVLVVILAGNCPKCTPIKVDWERYKQGFKREFPGIEMIQVVVPFYGGPVNPDLYPSDLSRFTVFTPNFLMFNRGQWDAAQSKLGRSNNVVLDQFVSLGGILDNKNVLVPNPAPKYDFGVQASVLKWVRDHYNATVLREAPRLPKPAPPKAQPIKTQLPTPGVPKTVPQAPQPHVPPPQPCFRKVVSRPIKR